MSRRFAHRQKENIKKLVVTKERIYSIQDKQKMTYSKYGKTGYAANTIHDTLINATTKKTQNRDKNKHNV